MFLNGILNFFILFSRTFTMAALDDIQRFHHQKVADLRAIFLQYAQMQKVLILVLSHLG
jgi:hypothetical protein